MQSIPGIHVATGRFGRKRTPLNGLGVENRHSASVELGGWLSAQVDSRYGEAHTYAHHEAGITVLSEGYLSDVTSLSAPPGPPAATILALYLEMGLDFLSRLRGSYTGLILDARSNQAHLFNDRRASRPAYYRQDAEHSLLAGPEVSLLASAAPALREIDEIAVSEFLIFASYYNDRTLFPSIKKLPPASILTFQENSFAITPYWRIEISPDKEERTEGEWIEEAQALFDRSIRRSLANHERPCIFLSGGIDSRIILGGARRNGFQLPVVSYGTSDGDDAPIARQLAKYLGLPFTFLPISTTDPQDHFVDAALRSDCRAETVDTPTLGIQTSPLGRSFDIFAEGDKSFYGHQCKTHTEALKQAGAFSITQSFRLAELLEPTVLRHAHNSIEYTIRNMQAESSALDPQDLRDKTYYEQRLTNRQNAFTAAALRTFEQARPWLDEDLVDFLFSLPGKIRTDNYIARKMLQAAHPDLAEIPFANKDSIPQARTYRQSIPTNPQLNQFIRDQFTAKFDTRLAALFNHQRLKALIDALLTGKPYPIPSTSWWHSFPGMWRVTTDRYRHDKINPVNIMLRLMQINIYLTAIDLRVTQ